MLNQWRWLAEHYGIHGAYSWTAVPCVLLLVWVLVFVFVSSASSAAPGSDRRVDMFVPRAMLGFACTLVCAALYTGWMWAAADDDVARSMEKARAEMVLAGCTSTLVDTDSPGVERFWQCPDGSSTRESNMELNVQLRVWEAATHRVWSPRKKVQTAGAHRVEVHL